MSKYSWPILIGGFTVILIIMQIQIFMQNDEISFLKQNQKMTQYQCNVQTETIAKLEKTPIPTPIPAIEVQSSYSPNPSWENLKSLKDAKITDLQKDSLLKEKFQNKSIKWTGKVSSVSEHYVLLMSVKMSENQITSHVIVFLKASERAKALKLNVDDSVTFTGTLNACDWDITIDNAEIIN
jgi:hypothetical protein